MTKERRPFSFFRPRQTATVPIVLSIPHCAATFPESLRDEYKYSLAAVPDDTDWFLEQLYDFAPKMGITVIQSVYSRWVIDLNRSPDNTALYTDGRIITDLCPTSDFLGHPIYADERESVAEQHVAERRKAYYDPYHKELHKTLSELRERAGQVLLWDCHSIRRCVPTICREKFPDLILGDVDGTSASSGIIDTALRVLRGSSYTVTHNTPFKGGHITRHYGRPDTGWHALQLEMSKMIYMDDTEQVYHPARAKELREVLQATLAALAEELAR